MLLGGLLFILPKILKTICYYSILDLFDTGTYKGGDTVAKKIKIIPATKQAETLVDGKRQSVKLRVAAYCRVSTGSVEQEESFDIQIKTYTKQINDRADWELVKVYADQGISGTQAKNRPEFQQMIADAVDDKIDLIVTKSLSRFARNVVDTLNYVRLLGEKGVAVLFEKENINTSEKQGELLLTILSALSQQESINISQNTKWGIDKRMESGDYVFRECLGYNYDKETKAITVNEEEAKIVRYIFERYVAGVGGYRIAKELTQKGYPTPRGNERWQDTVIIGIISNEKYKGDVILGKTFTVDPLTHKRLANKGEKKMYHEEDSHEPIVSAETFDKAQEILARRGANRKKANDKREKISMEYAFSSKCYCGFCGSLYGRRSWYSGTKYQKWAWQCIKGTKRGKENCPHSKGIAELQLEALFVKAFNLLITDEADITNEFITRLEDMLSSVDNSKRLRILEKLIADIKAKKKVLLQKLLNGTIDDATYTDTLNEFDEKVETYRFEYQQLTTSVESSNDLRKRIASFKKVIAEKTVLSEFDRAIFDAVIDRVIIGLMTEDGTAEPYHITFVFKTGYTATDYAPEPSKGKKKPICSYNGNEPCGDSSIDVTQR